MILKHAVGEGFARILSKYVIAIVIAIGSFSIESNYERIFGYIWCLSALYPHGNYTCIIIIMLLAYN